VLAWYGWLVGLLFVPGRISRAQGTAVRIISAANRTLDEPGTQGEQSKLPLSFAFLALALLGISAVLWFQVFQSTDGKLHVYFLDVGQCASILIVTPQGKQVWWTGDRILLAPPGLWPAPCLPWTAVWTWW